MSPSSDPSPVEAQAAIANASGELPEKPSWLESSLELITNRLRLVQIESRDFGKRALRYAVIYSCVAVCALVSWIIIVASLVALISTAAGWQWPWVALGIAGIHLLVAGGLIVLAFSTKGESFPVTLSEFKKDREWIANLKKSKSSAI